LRPLGIGEIVDASVSLFRRRAGTLIRTVALVMVPVQLVAFVLLASAGTQDTNSFGFSSGDSSSSGGDVALALAATFLGLLAYVVVSAACYRVVTEEILLERDTGSGEALDFAIRRFHSMIWIGILYALLVLIGTVALIIPGVWLAVALYLAIPVLLSEGAKGTKALRRSRDLVQGRWWHTAGALIVAFLIVGVVQFALGLVLGLVVAVTSEDSTYQAFLTSVQSTGLALLTIPFQTGVLAFLYFDLRVRAEGIDLALAAEQIGTGERRPLTVFEDRTSAPPPPPPGQGAPATSTGSAPPPPPPPD
jgi:hypothetical protein